MMEEYTVIFIVKIETPRNANMRNVYRQADNLLEEISQWPGVIDADWRFGVGTEQVEDC